MSTTPAARLARLKVGYPAWSISRVDGPGWRGFTAHREGWPRVNRTTVDGLEAALAGLDAAKAEDDAR